MECVWKAKVMKQRSSRQAGGLEKFTLPDDITWKTSVPTLALCEMQRRERDGEGGGVALHSPNSSNACRAVGTPRLADKQKGLSPTLTNL
uniref:Uncharacterized protein n=1 Tax=Echinococcus canadensis TaxID=519352 RepID=A0A915ETV5_9CEST